MEPLVGRTQIAQRLNVSRARAYQLSRRPDFPAPDVLTPAQPLWRETAIKRWCKLTGRTW